MTSLADIFAAKGGVESSMVTLTLPYPENSLPAEPKPIGAPMPFFLCSIFFAIATATFGGFSSVEVIAIIGAIATGTTAIIGSIAVAAVKIIAAMKSKVAEAIAESPIPTTPEQKATERKAVAAEVAKHSTPPQRAATPHQPPHS
jgi:hypothetical protein